MSKNYWVIVAVLFCIAPAITGCSEFGDLFGPTDNAPTPAKIEGFGDVGDNAQGNGLLFAPSSLAVDVSIFLLNISISPLFIFEGYQQELSFNNFSNLHFGIDRDLLPGTALDIRRNSNTFFGPGAGPDGSEGWYWYEDTLSDGGKFKTWVKYIPAADPNSGDPSNATDVWLATLISETDGESITLITHVWGVSSSVFSARFSNSLFSSKDVPTISTDATLDCKENGALCNQVVVHTDVNSDLPEVRAELSSPVSEISGYGMKRVIVDDNSGYGYGYFGNRIDLTDEMPAIGGNAWNSDPEVGGSGLIYWNQRDLEGVITRTFWDGATELINLGGKGSETIIVSVVDSIATPITLSSSVSSTVALGKSDFYSIALKTNQSVDIELSISGSDDLDLYLYDSGGDRIGLSGGPFATVEQISFTPSSDGIYYIEVYGFEAGSYTLKASLNVGGAGSGSLDLPGAMTVATAITVGSSVSNTVTSGARGLYSLDLVDGQYTKISLSVVNNKDIELYLYDPAGKETESLTSITESGEITYRASGDGTYYIEVFGREGGSYTLEVSPFTGGGGRGSIDVALVSTIAQELQPGATASGTITKDESGYYFVNLSADQTLGITLSFSQGNLDLYLYDQTGVQVQSSDFLLSQSEVIEYTAPKTNTYFVEIHAVEAAAYTLTHSQN